MDVVRQVKNGFEATSDIPTNSFLTRRYSCTGTWVRRKANGISDLFLIGGAFGSLGIDIIPVSQTEILTDCGGRIIRNTMSMESLFRTIMHCGPSLRHRQLPCNFGLGNGAHCGRNVGATLGTLARQHEFRIHINERDRSLRCRRRYPDGCCALRCKPEQRTKYVQPPELHFDLLT